MGSYVLLMLKTWPAASMDKEAAYLESIVQVRGWGTGWSRGEGGGGGKGGECSSGVAAEKRFPVMT